jgi:carotenoid cleavage dioxygenase-like enzyme
VVNSFPKIEFKNLFLEGIFEPCRSEVNLNNLKIRGKIPTELNGTFYRNGPNPQYVYSEKYHMYEGDGMIHAMTFEGGENGRVHYQNRWVKTERFELQKKVGKALFGGMRDRMARDPLAGATSHNTANTNVIWHHGKLLALNEGGLPLVMDPINLETLGLTDFTPALDRSMTAHPKIDPKTGELFFYSYLSPQMTFVYYVADSKGQITYQENLALPYLSMIHDFAITEHFAIVPLFPLTLDFGRFMKGGPIFKWEPEKKTHFLILPRDGKGGEIIRFEDKACLGMHTLNAFEEGDEVILDMTVMHDIPEGAEAFSNDEDFYPGNLTRWRFNLKTKQFKMEKLDTMNVEFPRMDERFVGRKNRHAYVASSLHCKGGPREMFDSITHFELGSGFKILAKKTHDCGKDGIPAEPIFVPKSPNSKEGEGFILSYVYRKKERRSDLLILDAEHLDQTPLAVIELPHAVPFGFHGSWKSS